MKRKSSIVFILLVVVFLIAACSQVEESGTPAKPKSSQSAVSPVPSSPTPASPGSTATLGDFTATDLDGNHVDQSIFTGRKLTMINIWATFCGPCLGEMPTLGVLHQEYQDRGFQVVGIVTARSSTDCLRRWMDEGKTNRRTCHTACWRGIYLDWYRAWRTGGCTEKGNSDLSGVYWHWVRCYCILKGVSAYWFNWGLAP